MNGGDLTSSPCSAPLAGDITKKFPTLIRQVVLSIRGFDSTSPEDSSLPILLEELVEAGAAELATNSQLEITSFISSLCHVNSGDTFKTLRQWCNLHKVPIGDRVCGVNWFDKYLSQTIRGPMESQLTNYGEWLNYQVIFTCREGLVESHCKTLNHLLFSDALPLCTTDRFAFALLAAAVHNADSFFTALCGMYVRRSFSLLGAKASGDSSLSEFLDERYHCIRPLAAKFGRRPWDVTSSDIECLASSWSQAEIVHGVAILSYCIGVAAVSASINVLPDPHIQLTLRQTQQLSCQQIGGSAFQEVLYEKRIKKDKSPATRLYLSFFSFDDDARSILDTFLPKVADYISSEFQAGTPQEDEFQKVFPSFLLMQKAQLDEVQPCVHHLIDERFWKTLRVYIMNLAGAVDAAYNYGDINRLLGRGPKSFAVIATQPECDVSISTSTFFSDEEGFLLFQVALSAMYARIEALLLLGLSLIR